MLLSELPHTQENSENFLIVENLRETQGIFKLKKYQGNLREILSFTKSKEIFFLI